MIVERLVGAMANVRVYELAKDLGIGNHDLIAPVLVRDLVGISLVDPLGVPPCVEP